jgi:hypothetical protein
MKKRPIVIKLKDSLTLHLIFADNGYNVHQPGRNTTPSEVWEMDQEKLERIALKWSKGHWSVRDTSITDPLIIDEIVEKRNSLPNLFMALDVHLANDSLTIDMDGNLEANRLGPGIMIILPNEKHPAEVWTIREKKVGIITVSEFTLYYDEGAWALWMEDKMHEKIVLDLGLKLVEKRNALKPSSSEQTLNLALDQIPKTA